MSRYIKRMKTFWAKQLGQKRVTGSGSLTNFYLSSAGSITTLDVDHSTVEQFDDCPNVEVTDGEGNAITGALVFLDQGNTDGSKFRLCFYRTTGKSTYDSGNDLSYRYVREGRKF